jgi:hypothetical protein
VEELLADPIVVDEREEPRSVFLRPVLAAAIILVLIVGVVVAIGGDERDDPLALLSAAPDAAAEAGTARMVMTMTTGGEGVTMDVGAEGLIDFVTGNSVMTMELPMGFDMEMRIVDGVMYMRIPEEAGPMMGVDAAWIGVPLPGGAQESMAAFGGISSPTGFLDSLRGVQGDIEELGTETVNGQEATGYRVTVDLADALDELPADQREELESVADQLPEGFTTWPMEVWLNDAGLPVREVMDLEIMGADMHMQFDLTDFGVDETIEAPPAAETHLFDSYEDLMDLGGGVGELD